MANEKPRNMPERTEEEVGEKVAENAAIPAESGLDLAESGADFAENAAGPAESSADPAENAATPAESGAAGDLPSEPKGEAEGVLPPEGTQDDRERSEGESGEESAEQNPATVKFFKVLSVAEKVFMWILVAFIALLTVAVGWLAIDKFVRKNPVPSIFGYAQLVVITGSMESTIHEDDMIFIKKTDDYKIGDIITFIADGETTPTTHRIIRISGDGELFYTRGDANNAEDIRPVTKDQIVGEVILKKDGSVLALRGAGKFAEWLKDGGGFIYVILIVVIIGVAVFFWKRESK